MGEGTEMQRVIDLCEAFADYIASDPKGAELTARKLADVLKTTNDLIDAATAKAMARNPPAAD